MSIKFSKMLPYALDHTVNKRTALPYFGDNKNSKDMIETLECFKVRRSEWTCSKIDSNRCYRSNIARLQWSVSHNSQEWKSGDRGVKSSFMSKVRSSTP